MKRPIVISGEIAFVTLTKGFTAIIDVEDVKYVDGFNWFSVNYSKTVYAARKTKLTGCSRTTVYMHREIMRPGKGMEVDHSDHDGLNNQKSNLRICTRSQNQMNTRIMSNSKSGLKGAVWCKKKRKWLSTITINGRLKFLGYYATKEQAHQKYQEESIKHYGEFACHG